MKIIVDKMPETPRECLFSQRHCEYGYLCNLRPLVNDGVHLRPTKPRIRCESVGDCDCLIELEDLRSDCLREHECAIP